MSDDRTRARLARGLLARQARRRRMGEMGALRLAAGYVLVLRGARRSGREGGPQELSRHGDGRRSDLRAVCAASRGAAFKCSGWARSPRGPAGDGSRRVSRSTDCRFRCGVAFEVNERVALSAFRETRLTPTFPRVRASEPGVNTRRHVRRLRPGRLAALRRCRRRDAVPDACGYPAASTRRDDHRAQMHRGLEHNRALGRRVIGETSRPCIHRQTQRFDTPTSGIVRTISSAM